MEVDKARRGQTAALTIATLHTDQSTFTRIVTQRYVYHYDDLASFLVEIPLLAAIAKTRMIAEGDFERNDGDRCRVITDRN